MKEKLKLSSIFFFVFFISLYSCSNTYEKINRNMLDKRNQKFWDYYHSVDYCKRVEIFDSLTVFEFHIYDNVKLTRQEQNDILEQSKLYSIIPNNFYGHIFWNIANHADTLCCIETMYVGGISGTWWIKNEFPPTFDNVDSLKNLVKLWKEKLNCDTLNETNKKN